MFSTISKLKLKLILRLIFTGDTEHWAKVATAIVVIGGFFAGIYYIFLRIFNYFISVEEIGIALADRVISIGFLAFFVMLLISNIISSISTLFRSAETEYFMSIPVSHSQVFWSRFVDNFFYSSWATAVAGFPMALAYIITNHIPVWRSMWVFAALLVFLIIPALLGAVIAMILMIIARKFTFKWTAISLAIVSLAVIYIYVRNNLSGGLMYNVLGDMTMLNYYLRELGSYRNPYFPHIWFAEIMRSLRLGDFRHSLMFSSALASSALFGLLVTDIIAKKIFFPSFETALTMTQKKQRKIRSIFKSLVWRGLAFVGQDVRALTAKDAKLFFRDANQWSQFTVLLVLLILYLANLRFVPRHITSTYLLTLIAFANFAFCGYILATLCVRFVYPAISMEGKSLWALLSSPLGIKKLFWEKFSTSFLVFLIVAELIALISNSMLAFNIIITVLTAVGIFLMSISLVSLNMGLGMAMPNFEELNPMRIASSGGGMIAALTSLIYVAAMVILLAVPAHRYMLFVRTGQPFSTIEMAITIGMAVLVNALTMYFPLKVGIKRFANRDF